MEKFNEKIPIDVLIAGKDDILAIFNGIYRQVPTIVVPLASTSLGKYGVCNLVINFDWFEPYMDTVHGIISGILWLAYMLRQFYNVKSIFNATASGVGSMVDLGDV